MSESSAPMSFKERFIGDYDYASLCMPRFPGSNFQQKFQFYEKDEKLPIVLAAIMGLQHAFAMVGGLITPPFVVFKFTIDSFPFLLTDLQQYAISAGLITSGICTIINVMAFEVPYSEQIFGRKLQLGSGLLSVMGTSFTFLPIYEIAIAQMKTDGISGRDAYGKMLGTSAVCALLELGLSLLPRQVIKTIFPQLVSGISVMLIGVALTGTGMKYWGGGVVCAEMGWKEHAQVTDLVGFGDGMVNPVPGVACANGETSFSYGASQYIGLGFSVMCALVLIELFGSTFFKNCNVIIALLFGYFVAGLSEADGGLAYVDNAKIEDAPAITFLWVETFKLGFYGPAVAPLLIAYLVTTVETVGDLGATYEASELDPKDEYFERALQGGLLSDAVCSVLSSLFTSMPNTTFSQNNGVISLTKCAARQAGIACGVWLIILGVLGKISGIITAIPDCVLGGMTIFLFANVFVSGVHIVGAAGLHSRRIRFIVALSMALGIGVTVWPYAFQDRRASPYTANFWKCADCNDTMKGLRNGVSIFLSTGYCIGTVTAIILNLILPEDPIVIRKSDAKKTPEAEEEEVMDEKEVKSREVDVIDC